MAIFKAPVASRVTSVRRKIPIHFHREQVLQIILLLLAVIGIAMTNIARPYGLHYWLAMVPIFALVSIYDGWSKARSAGIKPTAILKLQLLHWLGSALAVYLVYLLEYTGRMGREAAGLATLTTVALTTFLAGIHFSWRFCVLGFLLGATVAAGAFWQEFFWLLIAPTVVVGAALMIWHGRSKK